MKIHQINPYFGMKFKLSEESIKTMEKSTGLSYYEMTHLSAKDKEILMKQRGTLKQPNRFKLWLKSLYKTFGEKTGLLKEERYWWYTDID